MRDVRLGRGGPCHRDPDAVVRPERGAVGPYDELAGGFLVFDNQTDRVVIEIVLRIRVLLAHHVQVGLQDDDRRLRAAGRRRNFDDDVADIVLAEREPGRLRQMSDVGAHAVLLLRRSRRGGETGEIAPYTLRFQVLNVGGDRGGSHIHTSCGWVHAGWSSVRAARHVGSSPSWVCSNARGLDRAVYTRKRWLRPNTRYAMFRGASPSFRSHGGINPTEPANAGRVFGPSRDRSWRGCLLLIM